MTQVFEKICVNKNILLLLKDISKNSRHVASNFMSLLISTLFGIQEKDIRISKIFTKHLIQKVVSLLSSTQGSDLVMGLLILEHISKCKHVSKSIESNGIMKILIQMVVF